MYLASKNVQLVKSSNYKLFENENSNGNYTNEVVQELKNHLGPFDYGNSPNNQNLELRPSVLLESGATYTG